MKITGILYSRAITDPQKTRQTVPKARLQRCIQNAGGGGHPENTK